MRSQDNLRIMGNGMSSDNYDDTDHYYDEKAYVRFPNDDPKKWAELSGKVIIIKEGNKK